MRRRLALLGLMSVCAAACDRLPFFGEPKKKKKKKPAEDGAEAAGEENTSAPAAPSSTSKGPVVVYDMPEPPARTEPGLFGKATDIVRATEDELGKNARVLSVNIYYDYAVIMARDPKDPTKKRHFTHRGGALREQVPKTFVPADSEALARDEFALDQIAWSEIPKMNADVLARMKGGYGDITYISVHRPVLAKNVEVRYYCKRGGESVMIAYSAKGKFLEQKGNG